MGQAGLPGFMTGKGSYVQSNRLFMYSCRLCRVGEQSGQAGEGKGKTFADPVSDDGADAERNILRKTYHAGDMSAAG